LDLGNRHLPERLEEVLDGGLPLVAGVNQLEAFLFRLRLPSCRSARHFAGAFSGGAGRSWPFPLRRARSFVSLRFRCSLRIRVASSGNSEQSSEFAFFERLELMHRVKHLDKKV
jgi:hypothetical protein